MSVSVVVVTYSPGEALREFLDSLESATVGRVPVVLADNGSTDGSVQAACGPGVRMLDTGGNLGYGAAANLGVATLDTDWVVVANPDIVWDAGSLDQLVAAVERWPGAGAFGPLIRTPAGDVYPSARALPSLGRGIGHAVFGWWWPGNPWTASYRRESGAPVERVAGWLSGSCLLLRRAAFEQVGGFDTSFFMYFEDVDLAERLGAAGWQSVYVPSAQVLHTGGHATARAPAAMATEHHRSAWRYLSRHYAGARYLPLRIVLRVGLAARAALARRVRSVAEGAQPQFHMTDPDRPEERP